MNKIADRPSQSHPPGIGDPSAVDHPAHYNQGKHEPIDVIEDWKLDFHLGNVIKYIARSEHKGNQLKDLEKAMWYLDRKIKAHKRELSND